MTAEERLDQMIMDSFPASDPPSYWPGHAPRTTSTYAHQTRKPQPEAERRARARERTS